MTVTQFAQLALLLFLGGVLVLRWWRKRMVKEYTAREVGELLARDAAPVLLDVRTAGEYRSGSIDGAIHIPLAELGARTAELERFRGREIVCYCASGGRSLVAAAMLVKQGHAASNMRGGIGAWGGGRR